MREIELYTSGGGFVAVVDIPPFPDAGMPAVVLWGDRVFLCDMARAIRGELLGAPEKRWRYDECPSAVSLTPSPGRPLE